MMRGVGCLKPTANVMYSSAVGYLNLSRGRGSCTLYGGTGYTMLIFGFSSLCSLRQNVKRKVQILYTMYLLIYYNYIFLSLQYHA